MTRMMDGGHTLDVTYLYFAKGFDTFKHIFLLAKMKFFGLCDVVVCTRPWRTLEAIPMHSSVPQGYVLGPLFFLFFMNDLSDVLEALTLLPREVPCECIFSRWVWNPHLGIQIGQGSRSSDR